MIAFQTEIELSPFEKSIFLSQTRVSCAVKFIKHKLFLNYRFSSNHLLHWPTTESQPERRMGLWETTCCEAFVASPGAANYWELNASPAGHWNVFAFSDYRKEMREDPAVKTLPIKTSQASVSNEWRLEVEWDLEKLTIWNQGIAAPFLLGVTAVLQHSEGATSYWANRHPAERPDFHARLGFTERIHPK